MTSSCEFHFNTAISALMEMVNSLYAADLEELAIVKEAFDKLVALLIRWPPIFAKNSGCGRHSESLLRTGMAGI